MANKFTYLKSGLSFTPLSQPPLNPVSGDVYYDLNLATHRVFTNGKWFNLVRSETDLGPTNASVIIVDLDLGQSQKLTVVPDQRFITFKPIDGVIGNTYRVRLVFDDSANFVTPIIFHPVMQFASGSNSQVFATPGGSCVLNITPTASGYTATIESYAGYTFLHNISALPDSMVEGNNVGAYVSEGRLYIWGSNTHGQFGDGTTEPYSFNTRVVPATPLSSDKLWSRVSAGGSSVIAIEASTGLAWAWGAGNNGKLGTGTIDAVSTPASVSGGRSWKQVSVGASFSVGIEASTGLAWAWGFNGGGGQLGNQTIVDASSPVSVLGGRSFSQIFTAYRGVLALEASTGNAYAWGINAYGQLGVSSIVNYSSPVSVYGGRSFSAVTTTGYTHCGIEGSTGYVYCWGYGGGGVLGNNTLNSASSPVSVFGGRSFSKIAGAIKSIGAIAAIEGSTGYVWAWGDADLLGSGAVSDTASPVSVFGGRSFSDIKGTSGPYSGFYAYAASTGTFYVWGAAVGYRRYSKGYDTPTALDPALHGGRSWSQVAFGGSSSAALEGSTGNAYAWGEGSSGQLGRSSLDRAYSPVSVFGGRSYSQITAASGSFVAGFLALEGSTGFAWAWGYGMDGQLGNGNIVNSSSPVSVQGARSWKQVAASNAVGTCAAALEGATGRAYTWGYSPYGGLGLNTVQLYASSPVSVAGGRSWNQIATADGSFMCAIEGSTGYVWGWGYGGNYSLGNGSTALTSSPVSVLSGRSFKQIAIQGRGAVAAIEASSGYIFTWGDNGVTTTPTSPEAVATQKSFSQIYANYRNFFAIEGSTGLLYWWGLQIPGISVGPAASPQAVGNLNKSFKQFPAGAFNGDVGLAMDPYNITYFWGQPLSRQLGFFYGDLGDSSSSPVSVARFYTKF